MTAGAVKPASSTIHNMKETQTPLIPPQNTRPEATPTAGEPRGMKKEGAGEIGGRLDKGSRGEKSKDIFFAGLDKGRKRDWEKKMVYITGGSRQTDSVR